MAMVPRSSDSLYTVIDAQDTTVICAVSRADEKIDKSAAPSGLFLGLCELASSLQIVYAQPVVRQLVVEMHAVFEKCRGLSHNGRLDAEQTLSISREYRSALYHCATEVECEGENIYMRDFTIWTLFETMFFKRGDTPICLDLIRWGVESFTFIDKAIRKAFKELDEGMPVGEGIYWRAVCLALTGCRFDICVEFLSLLKGDKAAGNFIELLESLDWEWLADEVKICKLELWKHNLGNMIGSGAFDSNRNVQFLAKLLNGDQKYLERAATIAANDWWQLIPFYVFVMDPNVPYNELRPVVEECRKLFNSVLPFDRKEFDPFLSILCMEDISFLQNIVSNPWLSVHLVDTMMQTDSESANLPALIEIREVLLMEYGSGLIENSCLWEVGADYLLQCGSLGRLRLENHIEAMHIEDDTMAENLLRICTDQELDDSKACIINSMTRRYLCEREWSAALTWALYGGRGRALIDAANQIVQHAEENEVASLSMLDHLADYVSEIGSPDLTFLFKYYRLQKMFHDGEVEDSAPVLVSLLTSPSVPQSFYRRLFLCLSWMLADSRVRFSSNSLYELINFFNQYTLDHADSIDVDEDEFGRKSDFLSLKRMLLHRLQDAVLENDPLEY